MLRYSYVTVMKERALRRRGKASVCEALREIPPARDGETSPSNTEIYIVFSQPAGNAISK